MPNQSTGLLLVEVFTKKKSNHDALWNLHVWGCLAYVLDPQLHDGSKLPKWDPCLKRGQFVGHSPMHASTIGLVMNLQTSNISPQYHVMFDDFYETVNSNGDEPPPKWMDLFMLNQYKVEYNNTDYLPKLHEEWLSTEEWQE